MRGGGGESTERTSRGDKIKGGVRIFEKKK